VSIAATGLFFAFTKHFEQSSDLTAARQRGEMALSRLETAVLQAGLSMPNKTSDFEKVFVVGTSPKIDLITALRTATGSVWNEPVYLYGDKFSVTNADGSTEYFRKMGIVYCLGSGIGVLGKHGADVNAEGVDLNAKDEPELELSTACPENQVRVATSPARTDGWVTFSGCQTPLAVTGINNTADPPTLTVKSSRVDLIPFFAELQYVRALCAYVVSPGGTSPHFYVEDVTRSPAQPVSEGVSQVLFSFDDDSNVLTVHLLVRGNRKFPGEVTSGDVPGWPLTGTVTSEDRHYRLVAMSASWRVRN